VLVLALIGISFAGPLVRLSHAHPLAIAIWRLGFALIVILAALIATGSWRQWRRLDRGELLVAVAAGVMLAFHFWSSPDAKSKSLPRSHSDQCCSDTPGATGRSSICRPMS
jgi:hypothetical protein